MGLRDLLTRSKSFLHTRENATTPATATTPSPASSTTPPFPFDAQKRGRENNGGGDGTEKAATSATAFPPAAPTSSVHTKNKLNTARLTQLVGDNPPQGSLARVVKRKYQSITKERALEISEEDRKEIDAIEQYEVEFPKNPSGCEHLPLGIDLETDFYGKYTVVKEVKRGSVAYALSKQFIRPGHVVVAVNGVDLSQLSFQDVLYELKHAASPRVIRFLNPSVLPMKFFSHEPVLVNRDQYGFAKDDKYMLNYRKQLRRRKITVRAACAR